MTSSVPYMDDPQKYLEIVLHRVTESRQSNRYTSVRDKKEFCNAWADFWRYYVGVNVIPSNTRENRPIVPWKGWQNEPIPETVHEGWKSEGLFCNGMAILLGKIWHRKDRSDYYLVGVDADNLKASQDILSSDQETLEKFAKKTIVEQHEDNQDRMHFYMYTTRPLLGKSSSIFRAEEDKTSMREIPAFEIKSLGEHGIMNCAPSIHKNGRAYTIIGTFEIATLDEQQTNDLEQHFDEICKKYGFRYLVTDQEIPHKASILISELFKPTFKVIEGNNRHEALLRVMESLIVRNSGILSAEQIRDLSSQWNLEHCAPPLDGKEFDKQWDCAIDFVANVEDNKIKKEESHDRNTDSKVEEGSIVYGNNLKISQINPLNDLDPHITDRDYAEYAIRTIKRTVKCEDSLVRQIFYTGLSKDTVNPQNLAILCPTSEGKTYAVTETLQYFPQKDIQSIGSMTPKVLVRDAGILVDGNTLMPLSPKIKAIRKDLKRAKRKKDIDFEEDLREDLNRHYDNSKHLIDLQGKLLVFFEPPNNDVWTILKPLLSHDKWEIEYPYVDRIEGIGIKTIKVVVRGWPSCIFCSAKNESNWPHWAEIQSRFLITSTNMIQEKYLEGNRLIGQRLGLPKFVQKLLIVSDEETALARKCVSYILQVLSKLRKNDNKASPVYVPYYQYLAESLPSGKGSDNRLTQKIFSLLNIITLCRAHLRCKMQYGDEELVVADLKEDLHESLHITQNISGIPTYKLKVFSEIFMELYKSKKRPDKAQNGEKEERIIAVTTRDLCGYFRERTGKGISTDDFKKVYLDEYLNNNLIDCEESSINRKQLIWYPIVDMAWYSDSTTVINDQEKNISSISNLERFDNILQHPLLSSARNYKSIPRSWLELGISALLSYRNEMTLLDENENKICIHKFVAKFNPGLLIRYYKNNEYCNDSDEEEQKIKYLEDTCRCDCNTLSNRRKFDNGDIKKEISKIAVKNNILYSQIITRATGFQSNSTNS